MISTPVMFGNPLACDLRSLLGEDNTIGPPTCEMDRPRARLLEVRPLDTVPASSENRDPSDDRSLRAHEPQRPQNLRHARRARTALQGNLRRCLEGRQLQ